MKKQVLTARLSSDLERMRNIVYWTPGSTMNSLVAEALEEHLKTIEEKRGDAFPKRTRQLQPGRRIEL